MKSYIKIYGPPILKAVKKLEKLAIEMPEVSIMNTNFVPGLSRPGFIDDNITSDTLMDNIQGIMTYFGGEGIISEERSSNIISKSGETLGNNDFYFEWIKKPKMDDINNLIEKIDEAFLELGVYYTITTK